MKRFQNFPVFQKSLKYVRYFLIPYIFPVVYILHSHTICINLASHTRMNIRVLQCCNCELLLLTTIINSFISASDPLTPLHHYSSALFSFSVVPSIHMYDPILLSFHVFLLFFRGEGDRKVSQTGRWWPRLFRFFVCFRAWLCWVTQISMRKVSRRPFCQRIIV